MVVGAIIPKLQLKCNTEITRISNPLYHPSRSTMTPKLYTNIIMNISNMSYMIYGAYWLLPNLNNTTIYRISSYIFIHTI